MSAINSISELLNLSNCQFRLYDLGRKIAKITKKDFNKIELNQLPYPYPMQGHASFALAFWQKESPQPYLWFVKLPLDERGLLNQGARNHFIAIIVEALGSDLTIDPNEKQAELLKNNPYIFTPSQYKLAMLNSILSYKLNKPPSQYYSSLIDYMIKNDWQNWQGVGVQGITDFSVRVEDSTKINVELLIKALPHLPEQVLSPLAGALENIDLPHDVSQCLLKHIDKLNSPEQAHTQQLLMRSLSSSVRQIKVEQFFVELLTSQTLSVESLIIFSGRCWSILNTAERMMQYLEQLVLAEEQALFPAIFKDLVAIPTIRPILFQCMRATNRSDALAKAIGLLFQESRNTN